MSVDFLAAKAIPRVDVLALPPSGRAEFCSRVTPSWIGNSKKTDGLLDKEGQ